MARPRKDTSDLEIRETMTWQEYFASGMKRGVSPVVNKSMLITHIDEATGTPTYQGEKIQHQVSDGRGDNKETFLVEVLYDAEYVQSQLYEMFTAIGLITNNVINQKLWEAWLNPTEGKVYQYGATEGIRKQEQEDLARAKQMAQMIEGSTAEEWLQIIKQKRLDAIAAQTEGTSDSPSNGKTSSRVKKETSPKS